MMGNPDATVEELISAIKVGRVGNAIGIEFYNN